MDRNNWLKKQRREAEEGYDKIWSPLYDVKWGVYSNASHQKYIQKFLDLLPPASSLLDAACGSGRYMSMLLDRGHMVTGIDQAQGMLDRAREKYPNVRLEKLGLQEMSWSNVFDGAICMDALEHVCPEDWPLVLHNFHQALKLPGFLYFTVEIQTESDVELAYHQGLEQGLPVVYGEWINDGVYHYYPPLKQVREWLLQTGFELLEEGEGDDYHHFISRNT